MGDQYLRSLLVQGARAVMIGADKRTDDFSRWVTELINRRGYWRAAIGIAAKKRQTLLGLSTLWGGFQAIQHCC